MLDLQQVVGSALNVLRDLMPVRGTKQERTEDQHISALQ